MKSIKEKAKAYDESLERAKGVIEQNPLMEYLKKGIEYIFPELKESEDERIRKVIYGWIYTQPSEFFEGGFSKEEMLTWLEKQCKTSPIISNPSNTGKVEQKPAEWSEEDEAHIMAIDLAVNRCLGKWHCCGEKCPISEHNPWLKCLKDRVQPQPKQGWSEEEIETFAREAEDNNCIILAKHIRQLKSLRPQSTWKPSDEQIKVCKKVYADILSAKGFDIGTVNSELNRMEEELKKLREE